MMQSQTFVSDGMRPIMRRSISCYSRRKHRCEKQPDCTERSSGVASQMQVVRKGMQSAPSLKPAPAASRIAEAEVACDPKTS